MTSLSSRLWPALCLFLFPRIDALPSAEERWREPAKTLNTPRSFPEIQERAHWEERARLIKEHALVSCGLWPMPEKTPLHPKIFDRIERDGYTIEKVYFESFPGVYVTGNLYRPLKVKNGTAPGILNPHGHWKNGRMADETDGSIAARCIHFARRGAVAFSYDMVGYNDSLQVNHQFASDPSNSLWSISLMGLQTWNSIRALDFLASLPEVDPDKLACTGESGGGTQTFMLGAVDDRLAVQAPIVMVSHSMQGGCLCENAPGLRVAYSNMEIAASPAPRPQIIVSATGDWTKETMKIEGPAIESVYSLLRRPERFDYFIFDYPHNYNRTTREAVYDFFNKWLFAAPEGEDPRELVYRKEPDEALRVFPDGKLPENALDEKGLISFLKKQSREQWRKALSAKSSFRKYAETYRTAWRHALQLDSLPRQRGMEYESSDTRLKDDTMVTEGTLRLHGELGGAFKLTMITPPKPARAAALFLHPEGIRGGWRDGAPQGTVKTLLNEGYPVALMDCFGTGLDVAHSKYARQFSDYFTTYNRTLLQERAREIDYVIDMLANHWRTPRDKFILVGEGRAGLWALALSPLAGIVIADADRFPSEEDQKLLEPDLYFPGIRRLGGFEGIALLREGKPLLIHNKGSEFSTRNIDEACERFGKSDHLKIRAERIGETTLAFWLSNQLE